MNFTKSAVKKLFNLSGFEIIKLKSYNEANELNKKNQEYAQEVKFCLTKILNIISKVLLRIKTL
jgi:hypothetical protein